MSTWANHQRRTTPSSEPGTDWYCPIGTPIIAPADGVIYGSGNSIVPATGRWVGIDFDNGMRFRTMHHSRNVITSGRVRKGQVYAYSGASGYGKEDWSSDPSTGGAHVHGTLWPSRVMRFGYDRNRRPYTIDFMAHAGGNQLAVDGSTPFGEDDMSQADIDWMRQTLTGIANAINDPNIGLTKAANKAADHAADANGKLAKIGADAGNAANIASDVRNLITDPNVGVLQAIAKQTGVGTKQADVKALAAELADALGPELAGESVTELGKRLR